MRLLHVVAGLAFLGGTLKAQPADSISLQEGQTVRIWSGQLNLRKTVGVVKRVGRDTVAFMLPSAWWPSGP